MKDEIEIILVQLFVATIIIVGFIWVVDLNGLTYPVAKEFCIIEGYQEAEYLYFDIWHCWKIDNKEYVYSDNFKIMGDNIGYTTRYIY